MIETYIKSLSWVCALPLHESQDVVIKILVFFNFNENVIQIFRFHLLVLIEFDNGAALQN